MTERDPNQTGLHARQVEETGPSASIRCGLFVLAGHDGLTDAVAAGFAESGCAVHLLSPASEPPFPRCDFLATYGPMQSMAPAVARLRQLASPSTPVFVWFTEQVPWPSSPRALVYPIAKLRYFLDRICYAQLVPARVRQRCFVATLLRRAGRFRALGEMLALKQYGVLRLIGAFSETNVRFLWRHGLPATNIPMGYHQAFGERLGLDRDIDVVFLGSTRDQRRRRVIAQLEEQLTEKGVRTVVKDGSLERGSAFDRDRTILLNRSRIMLNVMRQPWDDLVFRLLLAAPNGAMLLSERLLPTSTGPFTPDAHFAVADLPNMVDAVRFYLAEDRERQRIVERAYSFVTETLTMGRMASAAVRALGFHD